jgi:subtilisin-like proprotein convertase family protein
MKLRISLTALALSPCLAHATSTVNNTYVVNALVPDNSGIGVSNTQTVTTPAITSITDVNVQLSLSGGWSGDLYAYLRHGSGFAVLLNRAGRTLAEPLGSGTVDLSIIFSDIALADIHTGIPDSGSAFGTFQPDGREIDPDYALDTSPRTAFLASFNGLDANGDWTLYVADVATGDAMTLGSWSLNITGVPEPSVTLLGALGACLVLRRRRG